MDMLSVWILKAGAEMQTVERAMAAPFVESIATEATPTVESIIEMVAQLSVADRAMLISALSNLPRTTRDMESFVTDERFSCLPSLRLHARSAQRPQARRNPALPLQGLRGVIRGDVEHNRGRHS